MASSLKIKFKGKETYIVNLVNQMGVESVMRIHGVKNRKSFLRWYGENNGNQQPESPFDNFSGGEKHKWNKEHISTILDCVQVFGEDWTKANFHFTHDTLYNLIRFGQQSHSNEATQRDLREMHNHLENIKWRIQCEHLDYVDSIERMRQLEIAVVNFAQMIAHQLVADLTPVIEQAFKVKPRQLKGGDTHKAKAK